MIIHKCDMCKKECKSYDLITIQFGKLLTTNREVCEKCYKKITNFINNGEVK